MFYLYMIIDGVFIGDDAQVCTRSYLILFVGVSYIALYILTVIGSKINFVSISY